MRLWGCTHAAQSPAHTSTPLLPPVSADLQLSPVKAMVAAATAVSAGIDFTVWIAAGSAMAAGNPQYGQLGDGSDHAYNSKDCRYL
eukprot:358198-Chlamydomonas_euryale.AAC.4